MLRHFRSWIPSQRLAHLRRKVAHGSGDGSPNGFGAMAGKWRAILDALALSIALHARQVQQHGEARASLHEGADRRASEAKNEVAFPVAWDRPVGDFSRPVAYHDGVADEGLAASSGSLAWYAQRST